MDDQTIINVAFAGYGFLISFILNAIWGAIKDLQKSDALQAGKTHEIEKLVAGQYVTKADFKEATNTLFERMDAIGDRITGHLDRLNERIDNKVSREDLSGAVREYNRRYTDKS